MKKAKNIVKLLKSKELKIAVAESCTGGLLSDAFVSVSGASEVFLGGIVSYGSCAKNNVLGVSKAIINKGVVSEACALAMAKRARVLFGADIALATTGYAEKSDREDVEDGTVFIALADPRKSFAVKLILNGKRNKNRKDTVFAALKVLSLFLKD